ncbi:hypothetical protein BdWA1_003199 [Babesia duncani]|uniref:Uncharacterized protein n=1 Tax=Babesia duncani TaxID=323732 RepID=A0AAD9PJG7_9APIC|nr:hypothetical protein BdWA1_003199 [Babesia duncani]
MPNLGAGVSRQTLSSATWAGTSRLCAIMAQVVSRGPNNLESWKPLAQRADCILDSFNAKHLAQLVVYISKSPFRDSGFINRLRARAMATATECDALACGGLLYGLQKLGACDITLVNHFRDVMLSKLDSAKTCYPLILLLHTYANARDADACMAILNKVSSSLDTLVPKGIEIAKAAIEHNFEPTHNVSQVFRDICSRHALVKKSL